MLEIRNQSDLTENHIKRKAAGYQRLSSNWLWLLMAVSKPSLANAEAGEDGVEDVVGGDFAGDFAQGIGRGAEFLGDKFGRNAVVEPVQRL